MNVADVMYEMENRENVVEDRNTKRKKSCFYVTVYTVCCCVDSYVFAL
mgnify:CR=1 FL=1